MGNINEQYNLLTVLVDEEQRAKLEESLSGMLIFISNRTENAGICTSYKINPAITAEQKEKIEEYIYEIGIKKWSFSGN